MDAAYPELNRRFDPTKPVGYLNYSDGRADVRFRTFLAEFFSARLAVGDETPWTTLHGWLLRNCNDLEHSGSAAFKDTTQAKAALNLVFEELLPGYREHHPDQLAHQPDIALFNCFFLARCFEVSLAELALNTPTEHRLPRLLSQLNDFVGYRPIALLETRPQNEFYPHEKVCSVPLYFRGVGVAPGAYYDLVSLGLQLLTQTDSELLEEACFDPAKMDELTVDPRATDHFHPVNKRPNVLFGEWDPHKIDNQGYYRRFVVRQGTLDALWKWTLQGGKGASHPDRLFESAAVLAGTVLMGAGICGTGPTYYDSTVTLAQLVQKIARFRDRFYQKLLDALPGEHGERLRSESKKLKQPFGGVRQSLNGAIASERAFHLQERRLAILYAAMGYPTAARLRSAAIPAPAARMTAEIRLHQTTAAYAVRNGSVGEAPELLLRAEELLREGIDCGALIDPWNILGFQGLFPTFTDRGDTVRDPRAEELILTVGRQFDVYASALSAASGTGNTEVTNQLRRGLQDLAEWWDAFATTTVTDLPKVNGAERAEAAEHVAKALTLWQSDGASDPSFWRKHRDGFRTPAAYSQVVEALLDHGDARAGLALLVTWLSESDTVPLQDPSASFFRLVFRWMRYTSNATNIPLPERQLLVRRFFELLEANADDRWDTPNLMVSSRKATILDDADDDNDGAEDDSELDEEDDSFSSAYEEMTFQDSADDGVDGSLADAGGPATKGDFPLEGQLEETIPHLRFLATVARLWRLAARPDLLTSDSDEARTLLAGWLRHARTCYAKLCVLTDQIHAIEVPEPIGGVEVITEFDRRRGIKAQLLDATVQTAVEMAAAARLLAALLPKPQELPGGEGSLGPTARLNAWEAAAMQLERAIALGDRTRIRRVLSHFIKLFRHEPLLVCPPSDGGAPVQAIRAQIAQQMMESLLSRLPKLGLLRETFHLTKLARQMERNDIPEGKRISSFDVLFRTAVSTTVDAILTSARDWGDDAHEDGPLAASLKLIGESYEKLWRDHSQSLRLSSLEAVLDQSEWGELSEFIRKYGSDLFTVRFLTTANVRGILAQGTQDWLQRQAEDFEPDGSTETNLFEEWMEEGFDRTSAARNVEIVLSSLLEHYDEYRDYNTTTTQSDYGENLYILLDFLRLKVAYDRYAWRMRPLVLAHDMLCKRGYDRLATKWREFMTARTSKIAEELLNDLTAREQEHGMKLRTVRDRLEERFVQPLKIDQAAARIGRAASARRDGQPEDNPSFQSLQAAIQPMADQPAGVGLDVPVWVRRLEDELRQVKLLEPDEDSEETPASTTNDDYPSLTTQALDFEDFRVQVRDWDSPLSND